MQTYCGFSKRAKNLLTARLGDNSFKVVEVDERADGEDMYVARWKYETSSPMMCGFLPVYLTDRNLCFVSRCMHDPSPVDVVSRPFFSLYCRVLNHLEEPHAYALFSRTFLPDVSMDFMKQMTGARTVPRIFIGGKCIGGFDELSRLETEGRLDQIL